MKVTRFNPSDSLIGLTFLRQFNLEIRPVEGRLLADRVDAA